MTKTAGALDRGAARNSLMILDIKSFYDARNLYPLDGIQNSMPAKMLKTKNLKSTRVHKI